MRYERINRFDRQPSHDRPRSEDPNLLRTILKDAAKRGESPQRDRAASLDRYDPESISQLCHEAVPLKRETPRIEGPVQEQQSWKALGLDHKLSHPVLVKEYEYLSQQSPTFKALNDRITSNQKIILCESGATMYTPELHTICISLKDERGKAKSVRRIRYDILFEMHNAINRGVIRRIGKKLDIFDPGPNASLKEQERCRYTPAACALAIEYSEWSLVIEYHHRCLAINDELVKAGAGTGPHILLTLNDFFKQYGEGWFSFPNYLQYMYKINHTFLYDKAALPEESNWAGWEILKVAQDVSPASLKITPKQVRDWQTGKTRRVKSPSNNPFASLAIIAATRERKTKTNME